MKLSEVIAELEKDPRKKFEFELGGNRFTLMVSCGYYGLTVYKKDGEYISQHVGAGGFNGNIMQGQEWTEVERPVTWQEAMAAWVDGKVIRFEDVNGHVYFIREPELHTHGALINRNDFKQGKWFIGDLA